MYEEALLKCSFHTDHLGVACLTVTIHGQILFGFLSLLIG